MDKKDMDKAKDFGKLYNIPNKRFYLNYIKRLINFNKEEEVYKIVIDKNKKTEVLPYDVIA